MTTCPCGGRLRAATSEASTAVAGERFEATVRARVCARCGEVYVDAEELRRFELAVAKQIAERGRVLGETFRFMRRAMGLTAVETASLLDRTPETLSRWEHGERAVDRASWVALALLVAEHGARVTRTRNLLAVAAAGGRRPQKVTRLGGVRQSA